MDYKEEYQKALERAKKGLPIDEVFPELKESEDERIRKEIHAYLFNTLHNTQQLTPRTNEFERWIAYLERQKDIDCLACDQHLKGYIAGRKVTEEEKQKEQVPAEWSDEDEKMLNGIIERGNSEIPKGECGLTPNQVAWLETRFKSLRPSWKPSEEQMKALLSKLPVVKGSGDKVQDILESLYNDLKKLI